MAIVKNEKITSRDEDFAKWYTDIVKQAHLAHYTSIKGCIVFEPYAFAIWENMQAALDKMFKETGHENLYMPMFIPESLLKKEAEHVEGFAPEAAWVTYGGKNQLEERLAIRPTSETLFCDYYSSIINSYRDLPKLYNQWCSVVRWEKSTRPFLRTSEFLWQEGHTVYASQEEADQDVERMLNIYIDLAENILAIPVLSGRKSDREKFAGAVATYGIEAIMPDGKCLQAGTSHNLGQNFAKASNIRFLNKDGILEYGYSTSWGISTRLIGALVMVHGDERGLKLPPNVAPIQVVIIPVATHKEEVIIKSKEVEEKLSNLGIRVKLDDSKNTPGWKFNEYEMKGVPIRIEIGPRDIENGVVTIVRRDSLEKSQIEFDNIEKTIPELLNDIQNNMYKLAKQNLDNAIVECDDFDTLVKEVENKKVVLAYHCGDSKCEEEIKNKTTIKTRVIHSYDENHKCVYCGKQSKYRIYFGKQY